MKAPTQPIAGGRASSFIFHLSSLLFLGYFVWVTTTVLKIDGMNCGNCERSIVKALELLPEVSSAVASLEESQVRVEHGAGAPVTDILISTIEGEGYGARIADAR